MSQNSGKPPLPPDLPRGMALLRDPLRNKGTAFTAAERDALGLRGLLPPRVFDLEEQVARVLEHYRRKVDDLERYIYLMSLQDRNETLFYRLLTTHLEEMMPIVYTPTVGNACQLYGHLFRRARGMHVTAEDRGRIDDVLANWPHADPRVIVITDGERILGLGDQGVGGMGIPVGKLSLYTACAGIAPSRCLPVMLDVGTENEALLADPLYMGLRRRRVRGADFDALIDEFITAASRRWPNVLIQFEDFAGLTAFQLLETWRDRACTFNDDMQGTAAVALGGIYSALRVTGGALREKTFLFLGAGEAGTGIANLVVAAMVDDGATLAEARARCWFFDVNGLVVKGRAALLEHNLPFAHDRPHIARFVDAVEALAPHAIIGVSTVPKLFDRTVIEAMARINERPIVFALSNPTSRSECTAEEAYTWSGGRAIFASGSPFPPVSIGGRTFAPGQGNNAYIFPGVGLGVIASHARRVTDRMFARAARALAAETSAADLELGRIYPSLSRIREVSAAIAAAVAEVAFDDGLADIPRPGDLRQLVRANMWAPVYPTYVAESPAGRAP